MKVALIGGHLSPALAVLDELTAEDHVIFFGRKYAFTGDTTPTLEYQTITSRGIPFIAMRAGRFQRKLTLSSILSLGNMFLGFFQSLFALRKHQPDVVVGFGGYVSVPLGLAAKTLGIPLVIHEQTLEVGLANKVLSSVADRVCISWEESKRFFDASKTVLTGNPMKLSTRTQKKAAILSAVSTEKLPLLYVTGGSTGSHGVNILLEKALPTLLEQFRIIHQTGDAKEYGDFTRLSAVRNDLSDRLRERYTLSKFISPDEVGSVMQAADIIVGRSGINTVTEILYFGKPALFIPLPYGQKNEQLKNAQFVQSVGLAEIVDQATATPEELTERLLRMKESLAQYQSKAEKARSLVNPQAAEKIYEVLTYVAKKKTA